MSDECIWLPPLTLMASYGDYDTFFDAVYDFYAKDFIHDKPTFLGKDVASKRMESYDGKDHSFWHCIEEKQPNAPVCEENRTPKIALCERIRWPRPIIEHAIKDKSVLAWKEVRRGSGTKERVHLFFPNERYAVVLDPRQCGSSGQPEYYFLWTTFLCEGPRQEQEMLKRWKNGKRIG